MQNIICVYAQPCKATNQGFQSMHLFCQLLHQQNSTWICFSAAHLQAYSMCWSLLLVSDLLL